MKFKYSYSLVIIFIFLSFASGAQSFGIGSWRDQLPYLECISVTEAGNRIYAATPYSIFYYDKDDNTVNRINKINGLSDIGISTINYSSEKGTLVIAYTNANIDLIKNNKIINISDIKRASILGNKTINTIYFRGNLAYLGCGFGIVVLDIDKEEISDTYYIGDNGGQVNVLSFTIGVNDTIYAGSDRGLYVADSKNSNLSNFLSWKKDTRMDVNGYYRAATTFDGEVIVSRHKINNDDWDSLYRYKNNSWRTWVLDNANPVMSLKATNGKLVVVNNYFESLYDTSFHRYLIVFTYKPEFPLCKDAILDKDNINWIADLKSGLIKYPLSTLEVERIGISGPLIASVFDMKTAGNNLYVVPGGRDNSYTPLFKPLGSNIFHFDDETWVNISIQDNPLYRGVHDLVTVAPDPSDPARVYAGSWGKGLMEYYNGVPVARYNENNTNHALSHHTNSDTSDVRIGGTCFDANGNLWVVSSHNNNCLAMKQGSTWRGFNVPIVNESDLSQIVIDNANQKWVIMRITPSNSYSLLVFSENGTPDNPADDVYKKLNSFAGTGNIPGSTVYSMAVDKNGQVWVGTEKGVGVFYNPENILTNQPSDAQQILVQQGAYVQYLMENEMVTAIAIDGANRKWIGTDRGGVFLFSEDGTTQIYHFTEENSPLFSDRISAIAINPVTGEVYFGTDKGIISFKSTATEGSDTNHDVYAFPNPVKEGFDGFIGIRGLVNNAQVRITDVTGNLVYSTKAEGGQAIWDGKNFDGRKAKTGVYLVFASNDNGSEKIVTKILIIN